MKNIILTLSLLFSLNATAKDKAHSHKKHNHHREHHAHSHGTAQLAIAFDGVNGKLNLTTASDGVVGFEHTAKNRKDKKTLAEQLAKLETNIAAMVQLQNELKCVFTKESIEIKVEKHAEHKSKAEHSNLEANFKITCEKSIEGSTITFNIQKFFPGLHDVDVQVIVGDIQKSVEAEKAGTTLLISK